MTLNISPVWDFCVIMNPLKPQDMMKWHIDFDHHLFHQHQELSLDQPNCFPDQSLQNRLEISYNVPEKDREILCAQFLEMCVCHRKGGLNLPVFLGEEGVDSPLLTSWRDLIAAYPQENWRTMSAAQKGLTTTQWNKCHPYDNVTVRREIYSWHKEKACWQQITHCNVDETLRKIVWH